MDARHWIEVKNECNYCGGSARCYPCGGKGCGWEDDSYSVECEDCHGSGVCAECIDGKEHWLFFTVGTGKRGSCLRRDEVLAFQHDGALPDWWLTYHGVTTPAPPAAT